MQIQIKNRYTDAVLFEGDFDCLTSAVVEAIRKGANLRGANLYGANLRGANLGSANLYGANLGSANLYGADLGSANLYGANLYGANLRGANLRSADLYGANLGSANLYGADLYGANLRGANLRSADLYGAKGINKYFTTPLYLLLDQVDPIRSYKLVTGEMKSPLAANNGAKPHMYALGESFGVAEPDMDETHDCGAGVNLATLDWCLHWWQPGYRILIAEHTVKDIAAIPIGSDGKYRVRRCTIVGEKNLEELGLVENSGAA